jgi:hypothetical protein
MTQLPKIMKKYKDHEYIFLKNNEPLFKTHKQFLENHKKIKNHEPNFEN